MIQNALFVIIALASIVGLAFLFHKSEVNKALQEKDLEAAKKAVEQNERAQQVQHETENTDFNSVLDANDRLRGN